MKRCPRFLLALALFAGVSEAQSTPAANPDAPVSPGHRLFGPRPGGFTFLVDRDGVIVHQWTSTLEIGTSVKLRSNGNMLRAVNSGSSGGIPGAGGGLEELAIDGTVLWDFRYDTNGVLSHHDIEPLPNGNVLMMAWEEKTQAEAIAAGRDPAATPGLVRSEHLIEVKRTGPTTGEIVWSWHLWDHLVQDFDPGQANFGVVADHPERFDVNFPGQLANTRLNHFNGIDYDPIHDLIVVSSRLQNEIWILDHSTTTAEAAGSTGGNFGRGGDLLYRWGNPQAYDRGTAADRQLYQQHSPRFVPPGYPGAGNITFFNNLVPGGTQVGEIVLPRDGTGQFILPALGPYGPATQVWTYADPAFQSDRMGSAQRLPNGNTLICSSLQARIFEVDPAGTIVEEFDASGGVGATMFNAEYVQRTMWDSSAAVSAPEGGTVEFDLVAGSASAGDLYLLLGSFSGTSPGFSFLGSTIPLNQDAYLRYTLRAPSGPFHTGNLGTLDALGNASSSFQIPPGQATSLVGLSFSHLYLTASAGPLTLQSISNVETFEITP